MCERNVVGYWISEKKRQKFNWLEFQSACKDEGLILKTVDITRDLECQGPFDVFLHKLTDILSHADDGNEQAKEIVLRLQDYIQDHPKLIVIDPLENVRDLRYRHKSYEIILDGLESDDVFVPNFVVMKSMNVTEMISLLTKNGIKFPCVCKPTLAHGSSEAHKMMIIFNEEGLKDCQLPCVTQELINHNAILYKVFIVDERFHVVERPSLKNFYQKDCVSMNTIFFSSHDISKSGSQSKWSIISEEESKLTVKPKMEVFERIVKDIRKIFGLVLVGVDVVIENHTGRYAIIDVNVFPSYDGYPRFFEHLTKAIKKFIKEGMSSMQSSKSVLQKGISNDLDSGFESDEKKKKLVE